jgi:hypothetical protein
MQDIIDSTEEDWDLATAHLIRTFVVPPLIGQEVRAPHQEAVASAVHALLCAILPGTRLAPISDQSPHIARYQIVHALVPAPMDETTGAAMALEVFGSVCRIGDFDLAHASVEDRWAWQEDRLARRSPEGDWPPIREPLTLRIEVATYANVLGLGYRVPLYL